VETPLDETNFAELLRQRYGLDRQQIVECRGIQEELRKRGIEKGLWDVILAKKLLTPEQLEKAAAELRGKRKEAESPIPGYRILRKLGQSATGLVVAAKQESTGRRVILKFLPPNLSQDPELYELFRSEANLYMSIEHPNLIRGLESGHHDDTHYYAMEFVEGENLREWLEREGIIAEEDAVNFTRQIAEAIHSIHLGGLRHHGVRPENILITQDGEAKLCDLGIAHTHEGPIAKLSSGGPLSKSYYTSPELARGEPSVNIQSDLYSLGITLFHMVTGRVPFEGLSASQVLAKHLTEEIPDPRIFNPELSPRICRIIEKLTEKERDERHRDPQELLEDLKSLRESTLSVDKREILGAAVQGAGGPLPKVEFAEGALSDDGESRRGYPFGEKHGEDDSEPTLLVSSQEVMEAGLPPKAPPAPPYAPPTAPQEAIPPDLQSTPPPDLGIHVEESDPLIGQTIGDRYHLISKIGEGGMGAVYLAKHTLMAKKIAVKILHPYLIGSLESMERFKREMRAASRFTHKNVIQIYDAGESKGRIFYMAMEFVEGEDLEDCIQRDGAMPLVKALPLMMQILSAIDDAHKKGIVHRDLKAGNVMLTKDREGRDQAKIMDFGIAKILEQASDRSDRPSTGGDLQTFKTAQGVVTGTPQYMSPEQAAGEKLDHRTDIYSLGVIFYEMIMGRLPFLSNTPVGYLGKHIVEPPPSFKEVRPDLGVPRAMEKIIMKSLEKRRKDRYQTAGSMLKDIQKKVLPSLASVKPLAGPPGQASPLAPAAQKPGVSLKKPLKYGIILGSILILAVIATFIVVTVIRKQDLDERIMRALTKEVPKLKQEKKFDEALAALNALKEDASEDKRILAAIKDLEEAKAYHAAQLRYQELLKTAREAKKAGDMEAAKKHLKEALKQADELKEKTGEDVQKWLDELAREEKKLEAASRFESLVSEGDRASKAGELPVAVQSYREALKIQSTSALREKLNRAEHDLLCREADEVFEKSKSKKEIAGLDRAIDLYRRAHDRLRNPETWQKLENAKAAKEEQLKTLEKKKICAELLKEVKRIEKEGNLEEALEKLKEAASYAEDPARHRGEIQRLEGLIQEAKAYGVTKDILLRFERRKKPEQEDYDRVIRSLEEYLSAFPGGRFADKANRALLKLKSARDDYLKRFQQARKNEDEEKKEAYRSLIQEAEKLEKNMKLDQALKLLQKAFEKCVAEEEKASLRSRIARIKRTQSQVNEILEKFVWVPSGTFVMGSDQGDENEKPRRKLQTKGYFIEKYEVSNREYRDFCAETGHPYPPHMAKGLIATGKEDHPVTQVDYADALAFCKWRSKRSERFLFRLPTEVEWEKAARGADGLHWPWGNDFDLSCCNIGGLGTKPVTSYEKGASPYGAYNMAGNVEEWTASDYRESPETAPDATRKVVKGGSYYSSAANELRGAFRYRADPKEKLPYRGFRCVLTLKE
jgi:serine/threonine protein kinase/formylglycine-generating enzyme required for sulfatase activity